MIKKFTIVVFFLSGVQVFSQQTSFQVWSETGIKGKFSKKFEYSADVTNRLGSSNLVTFFPQVSIKYKLADWIKPSIDYRWIANRADNGNYASNHRINANIQFSYSIKRLSLGLRTRYQYSFKGVTNNYEPEFDQAVRFKPSISYDLKNSLFSPVISCEFFYNPMQGPFGRRLTRVRSFAGIDIELKGPHNIQIGYFYDQKINLPGRGSKNVLSLAYSYNLSSKPNKKKGKN